MIRNLLLTLLLAAGSAHAQSPIEVNDQRTHKVNYSHVVAMGGGQWLFGGYADEEDGVSSGCFISSRASDGTELWSQPVGMLLGTGWGDMISMPDSGVLLAGPINSCDVSPVGSLVVKLDDFGNPMWSAEYIAFHINHIAGWPLARLGFASNDVMLITGIFGDSLTSWPLLAPLSRMVWNGPDTLALASGNQVLLHHWTGTTGPTVNLGSPVRDLIQSGTALYALTATELFQFSPALQVTGQWDLSSFTTDARRIAWSTDAVWVAAASSAILVDPAMGNISNSPHPAVPGYSVEAITARPDLVVLAGTDVANLRASGVMRTLDASGTGAQGDEDVALSIASLDSVQFSLAGTASELARAQAWFTLRVRNEGSTPLTDVFLNHQMSLWICGTAGTSWQATGMAVAPGDSIDVAMPMLTMGFIPCAVGSSCSFTFCIAALSPNFRMDRDPGDNEACMTIPFFNTALPEMQHDPGFIMAPNPTNGPLLVRFQTPLLASQTLDVLDMTGRTLLSERLPSGIQEHRLDLAGMAPGAYLVRVNDRSHVVLHL